VKRIYTVATIAIICAFSGCEKDKIDPPLGEGIVQNEALADSLCALREDLISRVGVSEAMVEKIKKAQWGKSVAPQDTAYLKAVRASDPVKQ
jgi:hypothetical protein